MEGKKKGKKKERGFPPSQLRLGGRPATMEGAQFESWLCGSKLFPLVTLLF